VICSPLFSIFKNILKLILLSVAIFYAEHRHKRISTTIRAKTLRL
jgi:hypothetical protein